MSGLDVEVGLVPLLGTLLAAAVAVNVLLVAATVGLHAWEARVAARRESRARRWVPRLLALLDGDLAPEDFAASVWPHQRADMLRFLVTYAVRLRGADRRLVAEAAAPLLRVARRYSISRSAELRVLGVHTLGVLSEWPPLVTLGGALRDPSQRVVLAAATALAEVGGAAACQVALTGLSRYGGAEAATVASLLARFGIHGGAPIAAALVHPRTGPRARLIATEALRRLGYVPAAAAACELLGRERVRPEVRASLLRFLGEVGGPAEAAVVRPWCASPEVALRLPAVEALGQLRSGPEDLGILRRAQADPDAWVALRATEALERYDRALLGPSPVRPWRARPTIEPTPYL